MSASVDRPRSDPPPARGPGRPARPQVVAAGLALVFDLVCVLAFAFGGKSSHESGDSDLIVLVIVWPFALAVVLAHAALVVAGRRAGRIWPDGVAVLATTYVVGMVVRHLAGRGIEPGFLVVAVIFLTATLLGWRGIAALVHRRRGGAILTDSK